MPGGYVLVVDDDPEVRTALSVALELANHRVALATNGFEALAAIEQERPALMLLDVNMPRLDGPSLALMLSERGIELPIIVMTSDPRPERYAEAMRAAAYLAKPFAIPEVLSQVQTSLALAT